MKGQHQINHKGEDEQTYRDQIDQEAQDQIDREGQYQIYQKDWIDQEDLVELEENSLVVLLDIVFQDAD